MNRAGAAAGLGAIGVLALAACSSGHPPKSASGTQSSASIGPTGPTSSPPTTTPIVSVTIGPFTQEFGSALPSDPAQASVVTSFRDAINIWTASLIAGHPVHGLTHYVTGSAYSHFRAALSFDLKQGTEPSGTDLMFDTRVVTLTSQAATLTTCDNGSGTVSSFRSTGLESPGPTLPASMLYAFETWHFVHVAGHWAISAFSFAAPSSPAEKRCQP